MSGCFPAEAGIQKEVGLGPGLRRGAVRGEKA
jgi:hypothetical protein